MVEIFLSILQSAKIRLHVVKFCSGINSGKHLNKYLQVIHNDFLFPWNIAEHDG